MVRTNTMRAVRGVLVSLFLALVLLVFTALPVFAIADPDSPPQVSAVYVYKDLLEDGDLGVLVDYYLDYATLPSETVTEAYLAVFVDDDGATQLRSVAPYTFVNSGYGRGLAWIYFTAAEVTTYGISHANEALYRVWLVGNPTLSWVGDPPKTTTGIDYWQTTGTTATLLALRVIYYADVLELIWSLDMVEATPLGNRLTSTGESYFLNVIANLRTMAPSCFSAGEVSPDYIPVSYDTAFGATATSGVAPGGATIVGSPVTLVSGSNTIDTGATTGTIVLDLAGWTFGTITDGTGTVTGSPADLTPGTNTLTVTAAGTFVVDVAVVNTAVIQEATVSGTGFDLTAIATIFGMSRWMFSGFMWMLIVVLICFAVYRTGIEDGDLAPSVGASKAIMLVFTVGVIGGVLLGLLHPLVASLLFIGSGAMIGYVFFFRSETLHKGFMFMVWMFMVVSLAGNFAAGSVSLVATRLTADVAIDEVNTISVAGTEGFADAGVVMIGDERIGYPSKTDTAFVGTFFNPITRGIGSSDAAVHVSGATVRTVEAGMLNASIDYKIARIVDNAGIVDFLTLPFRLLSLLMTFFVLPLGFLGTDLAILSYIWIVVAAGMVVGFVMAIIGGRRV